MKLPGWFDPMERELDSFFQDLFGVSPLADDEGPLIPVDLLEDETSYTLRAELPGIRKEDIHISLEGSHVHIRATPRHMEGGTPAGKLLRHECRRGNRHLDLELDTPVVETGARAQYRDGMLVLALPKGNAVHGRELSVH